MAFPSLEDLPLVVLIVLCIGGGIVDKSRRLSHPAIRFTIAALCLMSFLWWVYSLPSTR